MNTKTIRQSVMIAATPKQVYQALLDSRKHAKFTGDKASIAGKIGGRFSCYGGYITGFNLELNPGKHIVQAWRSAGWPAGYYSVVTFRFSKAGKGKTKLDFTQIGVPADDYQDKTKGWHVHYWTPLKAMFAK